MYNVRTWYFILTQVRCHLLKDSDKRNIRDGQCTFINGCHSSTAPAITCPRQSQVNQSVGLKTSKLWFFIWISLIWGATFRLRWQLRVLIDWVRLRHWETLSSLTLAQILVAWGRSDLFDYLYHFDYLSHFDCSSHFDSDPGCLGQVGLRFPIICDESRPFTISLTLRVTYDWRSKCKARKNIYVSQKQS